MTHNVYKNNNFKMMIKVYAKEVNIFKSKEEKILYNRFKINNKVLGNLIRETKYFKNCLEL